MLTLADKLEAAQAGYYDQSVQRLRKKVLQDLKRDPINVKIFSQLGDYYKLILFTRSGGFEYDTGDKEAFASPSSLRSLMKMRAPYGHQFIPVEEFYEFYQQNRNVCTYFQDRPTLAVWAEEYGAAKIKGPEVARKAATTAVKVPIKMYIEVSNNESVPVFHELVETTNSKVICGGQFRKRHITDIPANFIWIFPHGGLLKRRGWLQNLYQIVRGELPEYQPREIWMRFFDPKDAQHTYQYLTDTPLETSAILRCRFSRSPEPNGFPHSIVRVIHLI